MGEVQKLEKFKAWIAGAKVTSTAFTHFILEVRPAGLLAVEDTLLGNNFLAQPINMSTGTK